MLIRIAPSRRVLIAYFLYTRQDFPWLSPLLTNLILYILIRPVGRIKNERQRFPLVLCFLYASLIVWISFSCVVCGSMWNSIESVPDHCLFIYFTHMLSVHWLYRKSRNSVVKTLGIDFIALVRDWPIYHFYSYWNFQLLQINIHFLSLLT